MNKKESETTKSVGHAEKPVSLAPLSTTEALRGLLQVKPMKGEAIKKASRKASKKAAKR